MRACSHLGQMRKCILHCLRMVFGKLTNPISLPTYSNSSVSKMSIDECFTPRNSRTKRCLWPTHPGAGSDTCHPYILITGPPCILITCRPYMPITRRHYMLITHYPQCIPITRRPHTSITCRPHILITYCPHILSGTLEYEYPLREDRNTVFFITGKTRISLKYGDRDSHPASILSHLAGIAAHLGLSSIHLPNRARKARSAFAPPM
jgi:hypothetical protein